MPISKFLDPKNDVAFRRIFGTEKNKDILIHFINDILELRDGEIINEVTFLPTIQEPEIACKKESIVDVLCKDENGRQIIVEMQVSPREGFQKRALYYASKAYSRQTNKGNKEGGRYKDLKSVIFIAISDYAIFPKKQAYKSNHIIMDKHSYENDLKDFSFTFVELPKFNIVDVNLLSNIVEKWCYFFKYGCETKEKDVTKIVGSDDVIERAYEELNMFNWSEDELLIYEHEIKRTMDDQAAKDYVIEEAKRMLSKAQEEGLSAGRAEGRAEGVEIGKINAKIEIAKNLLLQNIDINTISVATSLSVEDIGRLLKLK